VLAMGKTMARFDAAGVVHASGAAKGEVRALRFGRQGELWASLDASGLMAARFDAASLAPTGRCVISGRGGNDHRIHLLDESSICVEVWSNNRGTALTVVFDD